MSITSSIVTFSQTNSILAPEEGQGKLQSATRTAGRAVVLAAAATVAVFGAAMTAIAMGALKAATFVTARAEPLFEAAKARLTSIKETVSSSLKKEEKVEQEDEVIPAALGQFIDKHPKAIIGGIVSASALALAGLAYLYYTSNDPKANVGGELPHFDLPKFQIPNA